MSDWQTPEALLEIAHDALRREVLPALEGELRYTGLMIANAVAIARRQCLVAASAEDPDAAGRRRDLERRLADVTPDAASDAPDSPSARKLVDAIRSGAADPGTSLHDPLRDHLVARTRDELEISNPRYLPARATRA